VELGRFYLQARLWQPAIAQFRTAIALDSTLAPAREGLRQAMLGAADSAAVR